MDNIKERVLKSAIIANKSYLEEILQKIKDKNKKILTEKLFIRHMKEISDFCIENFIKKDLLTQKFIRELHKIHFPPGYVKKTKSLSGDGEIVYMIPGTYKSFENFSYVKPADTKKEMTYLVNNFNENIENVGNKWDFILDFILNFLRIHPFGDGNGRVVSILWDIILIKYDFEPIFFKDKLVNESIKKEIFNSIEKSILNNDIKYFKEKILN